MSDASIKIELYQNIFSELQKLRKDIDAIRGTVQTVEQTSKNAFQSINNQIKQISFVQITQGLQNLNQAFESINSPGLKFGSTLADVSAITGITGSKLEELGEKARASAIKFGGSAAESLNSYKVILSKLGPEIANSLPALDSMENSVRTLSKTMGGDNLKAVEALTTSMLQYGVDLSDPIAASEEMSKMMNVMAAGAQQGAAEVDQVSQSVTVAGVAMKQAKVSFEEGNAAIQLLAKGGKQGAEAGTALRNILTKIAGEDIIPKEAAAKLKSLGVDMNVVSDTSLSLSDRLKELKKAQSDATVMAQVFGLENSAAANILLDGIDYMDELTVKITGTNTAYEQANVIMDSRAEKVKRMTAFIEDQKIALFEATNGMTAYLQPLSEVAVTFSAFVPLLSMSKKGFDVLKKSQIVQTTVQKSLNVVTKVWNTTLKANPIIAITAGVLAATAAVYGLVKATKASNAVEKINAELKERIAEKTADQRAEVEILFLKLKATKKGTEEYNSTLKELDAILPGIVDKYNLQEGSLQNINAAHKEAIKLLEDRAKAEAAQEMLKETMVSIINLQKEISDREESLLYGKGASISDANKKIIFETDGTLPGLKKDLAILENEKNAILNLIKPQGSQDMPTNHSILTMGALGSINGNADNSSSVSTGAIGAFPMPSTKSDNSTSLFKTKSGSDTKTYSGPEKNYKSISVRIDKLGCDLTFTTNNMKEASGQLRKMVTEELVGAIRDFETSM